MDFISRYNETKFERTSTAFTKTLGQISASGLTQNMGSAYILLSATVTGGQTPGRLRLYANQASRDADLGRATGNPNLSESIALVADIVLTNTNTLMFDPPVIGTTFNNGEVWYNISGSLLTSITLNSYQIGIPNTTIGESLFITGASIPSTGYGISGSITSPKSFIIITGSAVTQSRLRLYSRPVSEVPLAEQTRSFDTQSQDGSLLIADLMFDSGSFEYPLVPVLEAYTWTTSNYAVGDNSIGYILQNRTATTQNITASLYIYSTQD
jgi:hypothetical protein